LKLSKRKHPEVSNENFEDFYFMHVETAINKLSVEKSFKPDPKSNWLEVETHDVTTTTASMQKRFKLDD
jgi:hypothetical protein